MSLKAAIVDLGQFKAYEHPDPFVSWHNHGAGLLVSACRAQGLPVDFVGLKYLSDWEEFRAKIAGFDLVGISMMSSDYATAMQAIDLIKQDHPDTKIMVGGIHATVDPQSLLDNPKIDYILFGEGEITLPKFLKHPKKYTREIKGETVTDLDSLPLIDRTIYPRPLERNVPFWGASPMASFVTARGCPFNCAFCMPAERKHFGLKVRRRSVANVIGEIKDVVERYSPAFLVFHDDHFLFDKAWLEEFIKAYAPIRLPFWAATRADFVCDNPLLMYQLRGVGLEVVSIGFESGNQRTLDMIRKGTTVEQNYQSAQIVGRTGAKIYANIMYGFPGETREEQMDTRRLCLHIERVSNAMISPACFTPYPGNDLGDDCRRQGLSLITNHDYNRYGRDKIKGVDYEFLGELMRGAYDSQF